MKRTKPTPSTTAGSVRGRRGRRRSDAIVVEDHTTEAAAAPTEEEEATAAPTQTLRRSSRRRRSNVGAAEGGGGVIGTAAAAEDAAPTPARAPAKSDEELAREMQMEEQLRADEAMARQLQREEATTAHRITGAPIAIEPSRFAELLRGIPLLGDDDDDGEESGGRRRGHHRHRQRERRGLGIRISMGDALRFGSIGRDSGVWEADTESMSYEQLIDRFEDVKVGLPESVLRRITTYKWHKPSSSSSTSTTEQQTIPEEAETKDANEREPPAKCMICLSEFEEGEDIRQLPCLDCFHVACVDRWFQEHKVCPTCRFDVSSAV